MTLLDEYLELQDQKRALQAKLDRVEALFIGRTPTGYVTLPELRAALDGRTDDPSTS